jgi:hypothetical protein
MDKDRGTSPPRESRTKRQGLERKRVVVRLLLSALDSGEGLVEVTNRMLYTHLRQIRSWIRSSKSGT